MKKFLLLTCILTFCAFRDIGCVLINHVTVPSMVLIDDDSPEPIYLDCHYNFDDDSSFLVVKWFKNNEAVYQWIKGQQPSVFPKFKDQVDDTYQASDEPNQQYRKLALVNPTIDTTGTYRCVVQTAKTTGAIEKRLQVIDISNYTLNLNHHRILNETHLECIVDNVYPEPTMHITTDDDDIISLVSFKVNEDEDGYFNATIIAVGNDDDDDEDAYKCTVTFMDFSLNLTTLVTSGCDGQKLSTVLVLLVAAVLLRR